MNWPGGSTVRGRDFAEWQIFNAVAELGSFSRAAESLGMSASSVSQAVRNLESRVGLTLLHRTTRSVALSEAGVRMRIRLERVFHELEAMREEGEDLRGSPAGSLRVLVPRQAYNDWIAPMLRAFSLDYPNVTLDITVDDRQMDVTDAGYDVGVRLGELLDEDVVAFPLGGPLRQLVAATPEYFAKHGFPTHPRDLLNHTCIGWRQAGALSPYAWEFERGGRALAVTVSGPLILNDRSLCLEAALSGIGVVFWVQHRIRPYVATGQLQVALEDWSPRFPGFHVYYPRQRHASPALVAFIERLRAASSPPTRD
ncbi:LysR family transcriptional regulator [Luteibacter jiangsuensis]